MKALRLKLKVRRLLGIGCLSLVQLFIPIASHAERMGTVTSGGGGGGDQPDPHVMPLNGWDSLRRIDNETAIQNLFRTTPEAKIRKCPGSGIYIALPNEFKGLIQISGYETNLEPLCNDPKKLSAYQALALMLWSWRSDSFLPYLIQTTVQRGGPLVIQLEPNHQRFAARNGSVEEFTWVDAQGKIHWSEREACRGPQCVFARSEADFFKHETMHVLLMRVLQERYPREQEWHSGNRDPFAVLYPGYQEPLADELTPQASFIEGLANAIEAPQSLHPHLKRDINSLYLYNSSSSRRCYSYPNSLSLLKVDRNGFQAPFGNEDYVSTALAKLSMDFRINSYLPQTLAKADAENAISWIQSTANLARLKNIVDAIAKHAPGNLEEFAQAFDLETHSNLGYRWFREFFYQDYRTGVNTRSLFQPSRDQLNTYCLINARDHDFFTPWLEELKRQTEFRAKTAFASRVEPSEINEEAAEMIRKFRFLNQQPQISIQQRGRAVQTLGLCNESRSIFERLEVIAKIAGNRISYETIDKISLSNLYLKPACEASEQQITDPIKAEFSKVFGAILRLKSELPKVSQATTTKKFVQFVQAYLEARSKFASLHQQLLLNETLDTILTAVSQACDGCRSNMLKQSCCHTHLFRD
jgi:hypothetical protein